MAIKDILIHVDTAKSCPKRVEAAIRVARSHESHLTALYVLYEPSIPPYAEAQLPIELLQIQAEALEAQAVEAEKRFRASVDKAGVKAEWRCVKGDPVQTINLHARYADLVVTGQAEDRDLEWMSAAVSDHVALGSGRPVLVIPYIGAGKTIGERIYVAWNASREAVRAVNDAMSFLVRAKEVKVIAINPRSGASGHGEIPCADICLHLARHGVKTEAYQAQAGDLDVGDMLLSRAADDGADLIVMGAYGHTRFREVVLGGATRHLLEHMTVPVLMSH